jgi:hypothetical protein
MRGWLRAYRRGGFDALVPRVRADHGSARSIPPHVVDLLCQLKEDSPELSIPSLLKVARTKHAGVVTDEVKLPESTVHRVLARRGLMKKQPDDPTSKDRRRFEHECAGDLWMSDVIKPQGKGKMERWFRTTRMQLLPLLTPENLRRRPHAGRGSR